MIIDKLSHPRTHLERDDLAPNQKQFLWEVMLRHGATAGFAYDRFFQKGFDLWELLGVDAIKQNFATEHAPELFPDTPADKLPEIIADIISRGGAFYRTLGQCHGLKKEFLAYMNELGMCATSVVARFTSDNWKEFERIGIHAVIAEFEREAPEAVGGKIK